VHDYFEIDGDAVWEAVERDIPELKRHICSAQLFCHAGRLEIVRHVPGFFHEPVSQ
jgi:hypothetical protein